MVYKHFRIQIIGHLCLILGLMIALTSLIKSYFFLSILCAGILVYLVYHLFKYLDKIVIYMTDFLNTLSLGEVNQAFDLSEMGSSFRELSDSATRVKEYLYLSKINKEEKIYYLHELIEHLDLGVIAIDSNAKIQFINLYAKQLLPFLVDQDFNLEIKDNHLIDFIRNLPDQSSDIYKSNDMDNKTLSIRSDILQFKKNSIRLITIKDIRSEMEEQEMDSWQKLIRVLTHEIMNSITPITSLTATVSALVNSSSEINEFKEDIKSAVSTIYKRSTGLLAFVDSFRTLLKIPEIRLSKFNLNDLFSQMHQMLDARIKQEQVVFNCSCSIIKNDKEVLANPFIICDEALLQQILINLIYNALDAVKETSEKKITLSAIQDEQSTTISIIDSGMGIEKQNLENIFVPFFTTKKSGNGIGLSMVKQICFKLKAEISVISAPNEGCRFDIKLRNKHY